MAFKFGLKKTRNSQKLRLPPYLSLGSTVEAIGYKEALRRISFLRDTLINKPTDLVNRSKGDYLWLTIYILILYAQEKMIDSINDELIASDIAWDSKTDIPLISSTAGDVISYAEKLKDIKDHFLRALFLSLSGWTLLSTEKKECACNGKLREITVDVLVQTTLKKIETYLQVEFFVGVQSEDAGHLEHHYSFKKQSVRHDNLIIIHSSAGRIFKDENNIYRVQCTDFSQAEQFRDNKMTEILNGLIDSFGKEA